MSVILALVFLNEVDICEIFSELDQGFIGYNWTQIFTCGLTLTLKSLQLQPSLYMLLC